MTAPEDSGVGEFVGIPPAASLGAGDEGPAQPGRPPVDLSDVAHGHAAGVNYIYLPAGGIVWHGWED